MAMFGSVPPAFAMSQLPAADLGPQVALPPKKKGGLFGSGGKVSIDLQGALAGYLAGIGNPAGMQALQAIQQRRSEAAAAQREEAQYQGRRGDKLADYAEMQKIQAQYGAPRVNDTVEDYNFWKGVLSPEQFQEYVSNKVSPPQFMNVPGVGLVQVPRMGGPQMGAPAPQGVTFTPVDEGGPMPSASGGFPRSR